MEILVCHEKHGDQLWDASTEEAKLNSALAIVKIRHKYGYYYEPEHHELKWEGASFEDIQTIKEVDADAYKLAMKKYKNFNQQLEWHREEVEQWELVQKAVHGNDRKAAWELMCQREDHEYEMFTIEYVASADEQGNQL